METAVFEYLILWVACASFAAFIAKEKNRDPGLWFFLGVIFPILTIIVLIAVPKKEKPVVIEPPKSQPLAEFTKDNHWLCPQCNHSNSFEGKTCTKCKFALPQSKKFDEGIWECPKCKRLNHPDDKACLNCSYPQIA